MMTVKSCAPAWRVWQERQSPSQFGDHLLFRSVTYLRVESMPPRLNKRQQRELEELEALKAADAVSGDDEPVAQPAASTSKPKPTGFAAVCPFEALLRLLKP
jgi:hypothetical protein